MSTVDHFCERLRAQGRRVTPQRRAIIQVLLEDHTTHLTAERVFTRMQDMMPDMSPATVYNTLHELVDMGALRELDLGLGERHYDVIMENHAHLVCIGCGRVEDVTYPHDAPVIPPEHTQGFQVIDYSITFRGYCPTCALSKS
jgi:Fe2+ or Zn2+ uptake regulation protein